MKPVRHLLVTNDFPPKLGGIQSYLWELWRRLDPDSVTVLTTPYDGAAAWDAAQPYRIVRTPERVLLPTASLTRRIDALAAEVDAQFVLLDPALPLGALGPRLEHRYGVILHGAEVTVPARLPVARNLLRRVLSGASLLIAAGSYPADETARLTGGRVPTSVIPPGVDIDRFKPLPAAQRNEVRAALGLPVSGPVVVSVSRLVPRKGMDTLISASARVAVSHPDLAVAIAGDGRDRRRLRRLAIRRSAPVRFCGRVDAAALPSLYGAADLFVMLCRDRWAGLEQEGFGIVFLEAAACGVAQIAGASGGAADAVEDGRTGVVLDPPDAAGAAAAIAELLDDPDRRGEMGSEARRRAVESFSYDGLAARLDAALATAIS